MRNRISRHCYLVYLIFSGLLISERHNPQASGAPTPLAASPQTNLGPDASLFDQKCEGCCDVDRIEADTLSQMPAPARSPGQVRTWESYCSSISASRSIKRTACSFCHTPETGFTGPIQSLMRPLCPIQDQSERDSAIESPRATCTHLSHPCSTTTHSRVTLLAGISWDMARAATAYMNPSAEQARGTADESCRKWVPDSSVLRTAFASGSLSPLFESVWGGTRLPFTGLPM